LCITANLRADVADGSLADLRPFPPHVRYARESGLTGNIEQSPLRANNGLLHRSKEHIFIRSLLGPLDAR
jgi:hypothetical protein